MTTNWRKLCCPMMFSIALFLAALLLVTIGCGSAPKRLPQPKVPPETDEMPRVLGMTNPVRYWGDTLPREEYRKLKRVSAMSDKVYGYIDQRVSF